MQFNLQVWWSAYLFKCVSTDYVNSQIPGGNSCLSFVKKSLSLLQVNLVT